MKRFLLFFTVFAAISCSRSSGLKKTCLPPNLQNDIIAFYPFNDGSLLDESDNANDLTNSTNAAPAEDRNGNANCAFVFDNTQENEEFLTTSDSDFLNNLSDFSISLWYEPHYADGAGKTIEGLFSRGDETRCPNRMGEWSMGIYDVRRAVFGHDNSVWTNLGSQLDTWYHVVGVKEGEDYKIYWNGVLNESDTGDASCGNFQQAQDIGDVFVGYKFTGKIDDIIVYDRALTEKEIQTLYELAACCE